MNLYDVAIRRPVFTVMMMVALVVFGFLGYQTLPINLLPSIEIPMVTVITLLPGASPEVMESDVTDVIESAVNTIEGIDQITSYSGQGVSQVTVTFTLDRDIDIAAQDVRDKVSGAVGQLPLDAEPPIVQKFDVNTQPMLWMALAGLDARELSDYADQVVKPQLQSVPGVGNVLVPGFREPMIRIWIDRDKLAAHRLAVNDVIVALESRKPRAARRLHRGPADRARGAQPRPVRDRRGLRQPHHRHRRRPSDPALGRRLRAARHRRRARAGALQPDPDPRSRRRAPRRRQPGGRQPRRHASAWTSSPGTSRRGSSTTSPSTAPSTWRNPSKTSRSTSSTAPCWRSWWCSSFSVRGVRPSSSRSPSRPR